MPRGYGGIANKLFVSAAAALNIMEDRIDGCAAWTKEMAEKTSLGFSTRRGWTTLESSTNLNPAVGPWLRTLHEGTISPDKQIMVSGNIANARDYTDKLLKGLSQNNLEKLDDHYFKALGQPFDDPKNIDLLKAGDTTHKELRADFNIRIDELNQIHEILHSGNIELKLVADNHATTETNTQVHKGRGGLIGAAYRAMFEQERRKRGPEVHGKMKLSDASSYGAEGAVMHALLLSKTGETSKRAIESVLRFKELEAGLERPPAKEVEAHPHEKGPPPPPYDPHEKGPPPPPYDPHEKGPPPPPYDPHEARRQMMRTLRPRRPMGR